MSQDLLAEIAELKEAYASMFRDYGKLQKDADRYRWLIKSIPSQLSEGTCGRLDATDDEIEEAIDFAIAKETK